VLPFGNVVVTLQANGAEFKTMLENGVSQMPAVAGRFPQVSGLCFTYDIAENDFMAAGGDGYLVFTGRASTRDVMDQVVADRLSATAPISPAIQGRIACTSSGATACPVVTP
jgi:2',3'-cyclic-nucleotide 2'-phosphodiesterase (5'-nucleotidase family)